MSGTGKGRQARWLAFQRRVERRGLREYESLAPFPYPMKLWFGTDRPTRLFVFTKPAFINFIGQRFLFPKNWLVIERHSIPTPESLTTLHGLIEGFRLPLVFVGDLRPLDLTVFALLRMGSTDFSARGAKPLPITYAGLDDRWLALSDTFRLRGTTLPESRMGALEREHVDLVQDLAPDLPRVVGARSWGLLKAGHDVLMEMTCLGSGFRKGFPERLIAHLDALALKANKAFRRQ